MTGIHAFKPNPIVDPGVQDIRLVQNRDIGDKKKTVPGFQVIIPAVNLVDAFPADNTVKNIVVHHGLRRIMSLNPLMYLIKKEGHHLLYAHDTGIFPECTWKFLEGTHLDFVSLDCTALSRDWRQGHMGFQAVDEVRDRLRNMKCIKEHTLVVLNHFAHFGDFTHEKICEMENPKGYEVAYDGCSFEF